MPEWYKNTTYWASSKHFRDAEIERAKCLEAGFEQKLSALGTNTATNVSVLLWIQI